LQQQHAGAGFLHVGSAAHVVPVPAKTPLMIAHVEGAASEQMFVDKSQHAPGISCAHGPGLHAPFGPYQTPALAAHSHGVTCWQCW
jgi:hypothetical protein